jgi:hypothetical protein
MQWLCKHSLLTEHITHVCLWDTLGMRLWGFNGYHVGSLIKHNRQLLWGHRLEVFVACIRLMVCVALHCVPVLLCVCGGCCWLSSCSFSCVVCVAV